MKSLILFLLIGLSILYNTKDAVSYARKYCNINDYIYYEYKDSFGYSANFVSRCLKTGGQQLTGCVGLDSKGDIHLISNLRSCLTKKGWKSQKGMPKGFKAGYPFFSENHAKIATYVRENNIKYCSHSNNRCDASINADSSFYYYYL